MLFKQGRECKNKGKNKNKIRCRSETQLYFCSHTWGLWDLLVLTGISGPDSQVWLYLLSDTLTHEKLEKQSQNSSLPLTPPCSEAPFFVIEPNDPRVPSTWHRVNYSPRGNPRAPVSLVTLTDNQKKMSPLPGWRQVMDFLFAGGAQVKSRASR